MKEEAVSAALTGNQMRLIIAGGRRYRFGPRDIQLLNSIRSQVRCVLSGHAPGADQGGEGWAWDNDLPIIPFPAEWDRYEDSAGPIRNGEMARKATAVALFPGGGGTADMFRQACVHRLRIFDWRNLQAGEVSLEHCQPYEPIDDDRPFNWFSNMFMLESPLRHRLVNGKVVEIWTVENGYQMMKAAPENWEARTYIASLNPYKAKKEGRKLELRDDWEKIKMSVMRCLLKHKFKSPPWHRRLMATGSTELVEWNDWADRFWGRDISDGTGENHLGRLLMTLRDEARIDGASKSIITD